MTNRLKLHHRTAQYLRKISPVGLALMLPAAAYAFGPDPAVPEPGTLALLGAGAAAWLAGKWLRR